MSSYAIYHARLRGEQTPLPDEHFGVVPGFWRTRVKRVPVATWAVGGAMMRKVGSAKTREVDEEWALGQWSDACGQPVPEKAYRDNLATGRWPDDPPQVDIDPVDPDERDALRRAAAPKPVPLPAEAVPGHNRPPVDDPDADDDAPEDDSELGKLTRELEAERRGVEKWLEPGAKEVIVSQVEADQCANWAGRIAELETRILEAFRIEKDPLHKAAKACDEKWRPTKQGVESLKVRLKDALTPFLSAQKAAERKRQAEEAQRLRDEAQRARDAADAGKPAPPPTPPMPTQDPRSVSAGSGFNRKITLATKKVAVIEDFDALLACLKNNEELKALVQTIADRSAMRGIELPGMKIAEVEKAR